MKRNKVYSFRFFPSIVCFQFWVNFPFSICVLRPNMKMEIVGNELGIAMKCDDNIFGSEKSPNDIKAATQKKTHTEEINEVNEWRTKGDSLFSVYIVIMFMFVHLLLALSNWIGSSSSYMLGTYPNEFRQNE